MGTDHINRRDLLIAAGAASCAGLVPWKGSIAAGPVEISEITDMTMNSPSYATPIGYGRLEHPHASVDPTALAFGE